VLQKERNLLLSERAAARTAREKFLNPRRIWKARRVALRATQRRAHAAPAVRRQVRKSMARLKLVLTERAIADCKAPEELRAAKELINAL